MKSKIVQNVNIDTMPRDSWASQEVIQTNCLIIVVDKKVGKKEREKGVVSHSPTSQWPEKTVCSNPDWLEDCHRAWYRILRSVLGIEMRYCLAPTLQCPT